MVFSLQDAIWDKEHSPEGSWSPLLPPQLNQVKLFPNYFTQLKGKAHYRERSRDRCRGRCLQASFLLPSVVCPERKREVGGQDQVNGKKDRLPAGKMVRILHTPWPLPGITILRANLWDSFLTPWDWARFEQAKP